MEVAIQWGYRVKCLSNTQILNGAGKISLATKRAGLLRKGAVLKRVRTMPIIARRTETAGFHG